ncbi:MAG: DUF58 domain-containing protein [Myxococcales bacterium]|nr:DUF58 domain-containing protein [Myxococcales bacterium]
MPAELSLGPGFFEGLETLRRRLAPRVSSGLVGSHMSTRRGQGHAFEAHRAYAPGDDLRRLDWSTLARSDEPMVKVFRADEDVEVRVLIDCSASLEGAKFEHILRLTAGLGYLALSAGERLSLRRTAAPFTPCSARPLRGREGVSSLVSLLRSLDVAAPSACHDAVMALAAMRPGVMVLLTDGLEEGPLTTAIAHAGARGHDVRVVQVLSHDELSPPPGDVVELEDAETGACVTVTLDAATLGGYLSRLAGLCNGLRRAALGAGGAYLRSGPGEAIDAALVRLIDRAIDPEVAS